MFWEALTTVGTSGLNILADHLSDERNRRDADTANRMSREDQARQEAIQREFAQNGIKWRMEDAERSGVHPLYALGATGASYSPTISAFAQPNVKQSYGDNISRMGQDVSRALSATSTQYEREREMLLLEGLRLDNQHKANMIRQQSQVGPPFPNTTGMGNMLIDGQGNSLRSGSGFVQLMPRKAEYTSPFNWGKQIGEIPDLQYSRDARGYLNPVPSDQVTQPIEDKAIEEGLWAIRNHLVPMFKGPGMPDPREHKLPPSAIGWKWSPFRHAYVPEYLNYGPKKYRDHRLYRRR